MAKSKTNRKKKKPNDDGKRLLAKNRRARFDFLILDTFEAGLVLRGTEVKAIRDGKVQLKDSFVEVREGEAWLMNAHVGAYDHGNRENHAPERPRKLLLHRREIDRLMGQLQTKGVTIVPLEIYLKGHHIKVEIGLAKGKKVHDKRASERERELDREVEETLARRSRRES